MMFACYINASQGTLMKISRPLFRIALAMVFLLAGTGIASAQATRTWVSGVGDDANPCSRTAPCKTLAGAISKTAATGIIDILDPAGVGAVTVTKSITIETIGMIAGVLASGTNGVIINAGANDTVVLRGLSIDGAGVTLGVNGVRILNAGKVVIENSTIQNFSANCIDLETTGTTQLVIANSQASKCGNAALLVQPGASGAATVSAVESRFINSPNGILVYKGVVSGQRLTVSQNSTVGASAIGTSNTARISLDNSLVTDNGFGANVWGAQSAVYFSNTTISNNTTTAQNLGGAVYTFGNNRIFNNTNPGSALTSINQQ
jgi:hypothetical protein